MNRSNAIIALTNADVQTASNRAGIQQLLWKLGYDVTEIVEQTPAGLGVAERVQHLVRSVSRVAAERIGSPT